MREIKVRGKRADGKGWIYGDLNNTSCKYPSIIEDGIGWELGRYKEVYPETVGQLAVHHKNQFLELELYSGDIVSIAWIGNYVIEWDDSLLAFTFKDIDSDDRCLYNEVIEDIERVVGNTHDNPELVEAQDD